MSQRPSSTYNDPGYFYNQRRLLKIFFFGSLALVAGILAMIWADFDRPWKHEQRAHREWEASRMALEDWIYRVQTQKLRRSLAKERKKAAEVVAKRKQELNEVQDQLVKARGRYALADMTYKGQKQFTLQADYRVHEAPNQQELERWTAG